MPRPPGRSWNRKGALPARFEPAKRRKTPGLQAMKKEPPCDPTDSNHPSLQRLKPPDVDAQTANNIVLKH
jgi:hypothetical protein